MLLACGHHARASSRSRSPRSSRWPGCGWDCGRHCASRPEWHAQARRLALAGLAALVAQQVSVLVVIVAGEPRRAARSNVYQYAWAVYLLPYAVLAVPIATSAFTALSAQTGRDDHAAFTRTTAATTRAVVLVSLRRRRAAGRHG